MMVDFTVENFGPFKDEAVLSLRASGVGSQPDNVFEVEGLRGGLLSSAMVFGPNGSGKSYLLKGMAALRMMVGDVHERGFRYPWYEPFRNLRSTRSAPSRLGMRLLLDGVLYEYSIAYDADSVLGESLHCYPLGRRRRVFERDGPLGGYRGGRRAMQSMTSPSSSYLAVASKLDDPVCHAVRRAILGIVMLDHHPDPLSPASCAGIRDDPAGRSMALGMLDVAGLGISDYELIETGRDVAPAYGYGTRYELGRGVGSRILLRHDLEDADADGRWLDYPLAIESVGTRDMLGMAGHLAGALRDGGTIVIDGFGAGLHPEVTRRIVRLFSSATNPARAQLVASTHHLGLLDGDLLGRDQVWFADRDRGSGAADLHGPRDRPRPQRSVTELTPP